MGKEGWELPICLYETLTFKFGTKLSKKWFIFTDSCGSQGGTNMKINMGLSGIDGKVQLICKHARAWAVTL